MKTDRARSAVGVRIAEGQIASAAAEASVNGYEVRTVERDEARRRVAGNRAHRGAVRLDGDVGSG